MSRQKKETGMMKETGMLTEQDLLPCRKCGARPAVHFTSVGLAAYVCPKCPRPERTRAYFDQQDAIAAWNKINTEDCHDEDNED